MVQDVKEKVSSLEKVLEDFVRHTNFGFAKLQNALIEQKQSMDDFKEEMRQSRERSEKEMQEFKEQMNKRWGELANRLGTLAEDFVAPNIPGIAQKYFQCPEEAEFFMVRCKKRHGKEKSKRREFDIIAVYEDKVILNETKSTPRQQYLDDFAGLLPQFFEYFPEYGGRELIPIFSSLYVDDLTVEYATQKGIYVLAIKGDSMDLLNYSSLNTTA
jgi:hypothetical protein